MSKKNLGKRTQMDFSKHELRTAEAEILGERCTIHHLKKPGTVVNNIMFVNCGGVLTVTGDHGNWVFCRKFYPSVDGSVSDQYWCEKLQIGSVQNPYVFDPEGTRKQIQEYLDNAEDYGYDNEECKEYLSRCIDYTHDMESDYDAYAYGEMPSLHMTTEDVPKQTKTRIRLLLIFDAFEEICRRIKDGQNEQN